jgi:hypothetical protein
MESSVCATIFLFSDTATNVAVSRSGGLPIEYRDSVSSDHTPLGGVMHAIILPASVGLDSSSLGRVSDRLESHSGSWGFGARPSLDGVILRKFESQAHSPDSDNSTRNSPLPNGERTSPHV